MRELEGQGNPGAGTPGWDRACPHTTVPTPGPLPAPSGGPGASLACLPAPLQASALRPPLFKPKEGGWEGHGAFPRAVDAGRSPTAHSRTAPLLRLHLHLPWWPPPGPLLLASKSREPAGSLPCSGRRGQVSGRTPAPRPAPGGLARLTPAQPPRLLLRGPEDCLTVASSRGQRGWGLGEGWGCRD